MKQLVLISFLTFGLMTQASASLKDIMSEIGKNFGTIGKQINQGALDANALAAAQNLVTLFEQAALETPATVVTEEDKAKYDDLMARALTASKNLVTEVQAVIDSGAQNLDATRAIFTELGGIRKEGHDLFKPN